MKRLALIIVIARVWSNRNSHIVGGGEKWRVIYLENSLDAFFFHDLSGNQESDTKPTGPLRGPSFHTFL